MTPVFHRFTGLFSDAVAFTGAGRLPRDLYWLGMAGISGCNMCLSGMLDGYTAPSVQVGLLSTLVTWGWAVLLVRRGHDLGLPGLATFGGMVATVAVGSALFPYLPLTAVLLQLVMIGLLGAVPGQRGPNRFGPSPSRRRA